MPYRTVAKPYSPRRREIARACRRIRKQGFRCNDAPFLERGPWTKATRRQRRGTVTPEPLTINEYWTADLEPVEDAG